jgi:hypothetical protein
MDYFIVTASYQEALRTDRSMLFVGRKGSGKTANLFKIANDLAEDKRNFVTLIRPIDYDIEGILDLLSEFKSRAEQGFLMESLWKFLIYTEIALNIYQEIKNKPSHIPYSEDEKIFSNFLESNRAIIEPDFSLRLAYAVSRLCEIDLNEKTIGFRAKVSEKLHKNILSELRDYLGRLLGDKEKVCILIDNLDKAWQRRKNLDILAEFIFGLLSVSRMIDAEFQKSGITWQKVNLSIVIFLRSDIFSYLLSVAREADKIPFSIINWSDKDLLIRVIEERFISSIPGSVTPNEIWKDYFTQKVKGANVKEYIIEHIIPRPRDIIYLSKASLAQAVNRHHTIIKSKDIIHAEKEYSQYAYSTLISELKPVVEDIESLIIEFAGTNSIVHTETINKFYKSSLVNGHKIEEIIDLLIESLFLGVEVKPEDFRFLYDYTKKDIYTSMAKKTYNKTNKKRYKINTPFHSFLEINSDL